MLVWYAIILIKQQYLTCYWFLLYCFFFVGWEIGIQKIHDPLKMIAEFYAAPHFQLHKKVWLRPRFAPAPWPPPPPQGQKNKRKMQSSGIDLDVKIFHIDVSLFVLTLTARRRNYLFKHFLLYLRCGGALLLSVANLHKTRYVDVYTK